MQKEFYEDFQDYSHLLILQPDAVLIRRLKRAHLVYDYIGAAWPFPVYVWQTGKELKCEQTNDPEFVFNQTKKGIEMEEIYVGNGGLSLRKISSTLEVLSYFREQTFYHEAINSMPEDVLISYLFKQAGKRVPSASQADEIFLECNTTNSAYDLSVFGFHQIERWAPETARIVYSTPIPNFPLKGRLRRKLQK